MLSAIHLPLSFTFCDRSVLLLLLSQLNSWKWNWSIANQDSFCRPAMILSIYAETSKRMNRWNKSKPMKMLFPLILKECKFQRTPSRHPHTITVQDNQNTYWKLACSECLFQCKHQVRRLWLWLFQADALRNSFTPHTFVLLSGQIYPTLPRSFWQLIIASGNLLLYRPCASSRKTPFFICQGQRRPRWWPGFIKTGKWAMGNNWSKLLDDSLLWHCADWLVPESAAQWARQYAGRVCVSHFGNTGSVLSGFLGMKARLRAYSWIAPTLFVLL